MKPLRRKALATVTAGLLGLGIAAESHADVLASSLLNLTNVLFKNATTLQILDNNTDFGGTIVFTSTGDVGTTLNATTIGTGGVVPPLNLPLQCLGACPVGEDDFTTILSGPTATTYAGSDQNESGAPVANVPAPGGGVFSTPATIQNSAFVGIDTDTTAFASGTSNNNINSSFTFTVANPVSVLVEFDATAYLEAYVDGGEQAPAFATAAYNQEFTLSIVNPGAPLTEILKWSPDGRIGGNCVGTACGTAVEPFTLNASISVNAPLPGGLTVVDTRGGTGTFSLTTAALTPGVRYQFSARTTTESDATRIAVPEPTTLALMGLGMLGLGAARRRRKTA